MVRSLADRLAGFLIRTPSPPVDEQWPLEDCAHCNVSLVDVPLYLEQRVCPTCRFHFPIPARERIALLADPGTFRESQRSIVSLGLATSSQMQRRRDRRRTGLTEAAITGRAAIGGVPVILIVLDYRFLGGTLGAVMGEKVALAFEMGTRRKLPVVAVVTSGGARMQDGVLSLMQLAKTSVAVNRLNRRVCHSYPCWRTPPPARPSPALPTWRTWYWRSRALSWGWRLPGGKPAERGMRKQRGRARRRPTWSMA